MRYRTLGKTGIEISEISLGCEGFLGDTPEHTKEIIDEAIKSGINAIDVYSSDPEMRRNIAAALGDRRKDFIIGSHLCAVWTGDQYMNTKDLELTKRGFEDMLTDFGTDYIDIGMIHLVDSDKTWNEVLDNGVLDYAEELKKEGKIRHIGFSSHNPKVALKAVETGRFEVMLFCVNPCYDLQPASENVADIWADEAYEGHLTNMDPDRKKLYERCEEMDIAITVMKCYAGGDLLDASVSPAGAALTPVQCISYSLTRPSVRAVMLGIRSKEQLHEALAYETASDEEKDYATALATFPRISWEGHCMYCGHCAPCPVGIDVASVTRLMNLAKAKGSVSETVSEHYKELSAHAGDCIQCGACESRCPFSVSSVANMAEAAEMFGY
ncbi:MAG: aldo/keto reductase [Oscillospiraceae bacterium]|nr:aldo/keto reductase [Oscillospiraceae bacterium]